MKNIVIAGYARSPFTLAKKGALIKMRPDDLVADVVRALVQRTGIDAAEIEDLILGCAFPEGEQGLNMARLVALRAGLPLSVGGVTVNRFCGSSMHAIHIAAGQIGIGAGDAFICAGVESMTRVPMGGYNPMPNPALNADMPGAYVGMGDTAENVARRWQITRAAQEELALRSHQRAAAAQAAGKLTDEIVPIKVNGTTVEQDGCIRADTSTEALAGLKPAFDQDGSVTAGTSSPLTDGAAAVLVCSEGLCQAPQPRAPRAARRRGRRRVRARHHGHRPRRGDPQGAEARQYRDERDRRRRAERSVRGTGARLHEGPRDPRGDPEHRWRCHRARPSARRDRRADHRQGREPAEARGRPLCVGHAMYRRWPGHRHDHGASVMSAGAIRKVAVIGSGVMGSGIAAQVANAGVPVLLLDIVGKDETDRASIARGAVAKLLKTEPAPLMSPEERRPHQCRQYR